MRLRPLKPKDAQGMLEWMHDEKVNRVFQNDFGSFTLQKVLGFIESSADESVNLHRACVNDEDEYLGTVSIKGIDRLASNGEYAVSFRTMAHGTGAATFATKEILRIAFRELGLERVYLNVITDNGRANGFYKKMGFIYEGTFKRHVLAGGELKDLNWYRMLREEYTKLYGNE